MSYVIAFDFEAAGGVPLKHGFTELGAVCFDMVNGNVIDSFYLSASMKNFEWEPRCLEEFWLKNPNLYEETKKCVYAPDVQDPRVVIKHFYNWCQDIKKDYPDVYMITDNSTFDSGILKYFSDFDTYYFLGPPMDIVDVSAVYMGIQRRPMNRKLIDSSSFKGCVEALGLAPFEYENVSPHCATADAEEIARRWKYIQDALHPRFLAKQKLQDALQLQDFLKIKTSV